MRFLLAAVLSATFALSGCAATTDDEGRQVPINENDSASLRGATDIEGTAAVGEPITLTYERKPEYTSVPYLAVEILPDASGAAGQVHVSGLFPGSPRVIVADEHFNVLESTATSEVQADGSRQSVTTLAVPHGGKLIAIVHDALWSRPMSFEIRSSLATR